MKRTVSRVTMSDSMQVVGLARSDSQGGSFLVILGDSFNRADGERVF
jgi:hypothetical protein